MGTNVKQRHLTDVNRNSPELDFLHLTKLIELKFSAISYLKGFMKDAYCQF